MSHYMTALAMKQKGLKPATKIVLYWLAEHHNGESGRCFPSLNRLALCCEMDKSTVVRHIDALVEKGLVQRRKTTRPDGGFSSTTYVLYIDEPLLQNTTSPSGEKEPPLVAKCNTNLGSNNHLLSELEQSEFDLFWDYYPKKVAKGDAKKAFKKALKKVSGSQLILAVQPYAESVKHKDPKFIPHASRWLNGERWADQLDQSKDTGMDENMMLNVLKEVGLKYDA